MPALKSTVISAHTSAFHTAKYPTYETTIMSTHVSAQFPANKSAFGTTDNPTFGPAFCAAEFTT
jgi:hypothetical protein